LPARPALQQTVHRGVLLAGDFETEVIGAGVRPQVQEWLKNYLLSRIAAQ
jgi:hypothetical protein